MAQVVCVPKLVLAMVLRAMVSPTNVDYHSDEDFVVIRWPLLLAQGAPAYLPTTADPKVPALAYCAHPRPTPRCPPRPIVLINEALTPMNTHVHISL